MHPSVPAVAMAALLSISRSTAIGGRVGMAILRRGAETTFVNSFPTRSVTSSSHASRSSTLQPLEQSTSLEPFRVNLLTLPLPELETLLKSWDVPAYRARQIHTRIFSQGVTDIDQMTDLPLKVRVLLKERATIGSLSLDIEQISKDGTTKRAYRLHDGQVIESVLMPYEDGRRTACISSQAGCAMGCVFCATGQMGFARQLTAEEIYEQVARFASELKGEGERLSNVVMMGMGEPLANYRNVMTAIRRMNNELGIGARKITVSTVGVVPNIKKLIDEDLPIRLALSLHCATDDERTALLPANRRYGGLDELMSTIREYIQVKKQRVTFEWALIEGENDSKDVARTLGRLLQRHGIRSDMAHVNLIPLNPTGGYGGGPSGRANVQKFVEVLEKEFAVSATPRMRRGIDIDAGCGQLTASVKKREEKALATRHVGLPVVGVYEDEEGGSDDGVVNEEVESTLDFSIDSDCVDLDEDEDFVDPAYDDDFELAEAERLIALVKGTAPTKREEGGKSLQSEHDHNQEQKKKSTTITDEDAMRKAKKKRRKLLKQLKAIQKLKDMERAGRALNQEQVEKVAKGREWGLELESVEHNLM
ncbi:hypothetical protein ACHAWF_004993 [Thalassiosira exigua]